MTAPSVEVLEARLNALEAMAIERDKRYEERHQADQEAVRAALAAAKEAVAAAMSASEKAAEKFEKALQEYKAGANEWRDTVKDLIANLRESRSQGSGKDEAVEQSKINTRWMIGIAVALVLGAIAQVAAYLRAAQQ